MMKIDNVEKNKMSISTKDVSTSQSKSRKTSEEDQIIDFTNQQRKTHGLVSLNANSELMKLAEEQAKLMTSANQLSHSVGGQSLSVRLRRSQCNYMAAGENIAEGQSDAKEVVGDWMQSPGHRQNIVNPQYKEIGVACMQSASGRKYYVQVFARLTRP